MLVAEHARTAPEPPDGETRRWCCGISLRYAWRRHLARNASVGWLSGRMRPTANVGVSGLVMAQHLSTRPQRSGYQPTMDTMRALVLWLPKAWGLGAVRKVAAPAPSPLVPSACYPDQQVTEESNASAVSFADGRPGTSCQAPGITRSNDCRGQIAVK